MIHTQEEKEGGEYIRHKAHARKMAQASQNNQRKGVQKTKELGIEREKKERKNKRDKKDLYIR